jgi:hypothetical protein
MSDTTAKIRGKGLEHTGVTEDHAAHMYNNIGGHYVGVVDLKVVRHSVDDQGNRSVELVIDTIEVAPNDDTAEHIRRLTRAFHYERGLAVNGGDQLPIEGNDEPTVEQVRAAGAALEILDDDEDDNLDDDPDVDEEPDEPVVEETAQLDDSPRAMLDDRPADDVFDPANQPHDYAGTPGDPDGCNICGGPTNWGIHDTARTTTSRGVPNPFDPVPAA